MISQSTFFLLSWLVLAALLFFPTSKLIWTFSVRRLQRRTQRELTAEETRGQLNRARFIALIVVAIFSFLFNSSMIGPLQL